MNTSPPYPNNYDFADATRLEMTFWEEVDAWDDLHDAVRKHLVCSCSQHSAADRLDLLELLDVPRINPIRDGIATVSTGLEQVRLTKGGRKTSHTMFAAYFSHLSVVWIALRRLTGSGSKSRLLSVTLHPIGSMCHATSGSAGWQLRRVSRRTSSRRFVIETRSGGTGSTAFL